MRAPVRNLIQSPTATSPAAGPASAASRAVTVEAALSRGRAAALHGDPLAVEAAGRACVVALFRALLAVLAHTIGGMFRPAWRSVRGQRTRPGNVADLGL